MNLGSRALDLLIKYCTMAKSDGILKLDFCGESRFDGRPVWVLQRHLCLIRRRRNLSRSIGGDFHR